VFAAGDLTFDSAGKLYVSNLEASHNSVTVYAAQTFHLLRTITQGLDYPLWLALDKRNRLYALNLYGEETGSVTVYAPDTSQPMRTITDGILGPTTMVLDPSGDLYVANGKICNSSRKCNQGSVSAYAPSSDEPSLQIKIGIHNPVTLAIDPKH
jgi:DNA-binding beta-propeller fold protein YncE